MLIAADVGGTNSRIGLFAREAPRPRLVAMQAYETGRFESLGQILSLFVREAASGAIEAAAIGVAGPIVRQRASLTNVDWEVSAVEVATQLGTPRVRLLNDLEAMATSIGVLRNEELEALQAGTPDPDGNAVILAAGTGLGEAYLPRFDGRFRVLASEAGHADFAARTDREMALVGMLRRDYGRASVEHVLSGPGFLNLHRFTHAAGQVCTAVPDISAQNAAAQVSLAGMEGRCRHCAEAVAMFVEALGAEAGNLGLRGTASAGVFIGGGIAPRILPALRSECFRAALLDKAPMESLVTRMPVYVILNRDAGLIGAAVAAEALAG